MHLFNSEKLLKAAVTGKWKGMGQGQINILFCFVIQSLDKSVYLGHVESFTVKLVCVQQKCEGGPMSWKRTQSICFLRLCFSASYRKSIAVSSSREEFLLFQVTHQPKTRSGRKRLVERECPAADGLERSGTEPLTRESPTMSTAPFTPVWRQSTK